MKYKLTPEQIEMLKQNKHDCDLFLRYVKLLEDSIKEIRKQLNKGHRPERKLQNIELIVQEIEKRI